MMALDTVQFVVGKDGQPVAVQVDLDLWCQAVRRRPPYAYDDLAELAEQVA